MVNRVWTAQNLRSSEIGDAKGRYALRLLTEEGGQMEVLGVYRAGHDGQGGENHTLIMMFYAEQSSLAYQGLAQAMERESARSLQPFMQRKWGVRADLGIATIFTIIEPT